MASRRTKQGVIRAAGRRNLPAFEETNGRPMVEKVPGIIDKALKVERGFWGHAQAESSWILTLTRRVLLGFNLVF